MHTIEYFYSILLGVVQGLTEFWPISSSGHLVIAHDVLRFDFADTVSFDVALHLGTLVALVWFFWSDILRYIVAFFKSLAKWNIKADFDQRMAWYLVVATVPAGLTGYFLESIIETSLRNLWLVAGLLIGVGIFFIVFERIFQPRKELVDITWGMAIAIGVAQALALLPGVSRSGITILTGIAQGLKREAAARFSFLLSIPVVFGAGLKKCYDIVQSGVAGDQLISMAVGFIAAAVVGYFAIKFLLRYLAGHSLSMFAYYRFALGAAVIVYLLVK